MIKSMRNLLRRQSSKGEEFNWQEKNAELVELINARKMEAAQVLGQELLDYVDKKYRKDSREKATTYNNMGMVFLLTQQYELAEECFFPALNMRKRIFGDNHNEVAVILMNLVQLYKTQALAILAANRVEISD